MDAHATLAIISSLTALIGLAWCRLGRAAKLPGSRRFAIKPLRVFTKGFDPSREAHGDVVNFPQEMRAARSNGGGGVSPNEGGRPVTGHVRTHDGSATTR